MYLQRGWRTVAAWRGAGCYGDAPKAAERFALVDQAVVYRAVALELRDLTLAGWCPTRPGSDWTAPDSHPTALPLPATDEFWAALEATTATKSQELFGI